MATENLPTQRKARYAVKFGRKIGEGSYRTVYKTIRSRWVYKEDIHGSYGSHGNREEFEAYTSLSNNNRLPNGVKLPEMHMVGNYLAAEYIKGKHPANWCTPSRYRDYKADHYSNCPGEKECWATKCNGVPVNDLHNENVIITADGTIYIVDVGHGETY